MRGRQVVLAVIAATLSIGVGIWRLVRAFSGGSSSTRSFLLAAQPADPSCANSTNYYAPQCSDNPCNPTSAQYQSGNPGCQSFSVPRVPTFPVTEPGTGTTPRPPPTKGPPPAGPIPGGRLSKSVGQQLVTFARVKPRSITCPSLARQKGATVMCPVSGTALDAGKAHVHGTAQVTIQDTTGQAAQVIFDFRGPGDLVIRGTGYPFDPDTGRVL